MNPVKRLAHGSGSVEPTTRYWSLGTTSIPQGNLYCVCAITSEGRVIYQAMQVSRKVPPGKLLTPAGSKFVEMPGDDAQGMLEAASASAHVWAVTPNIVDIFDEEDAEHRFGRWLSRRVFPADLEWYPRGKYSPPENGIHMPRSPGCWDQHLGHDTCRTSVVFLDFALERDREGNTIYYRAETCGQFRTDWKLKYDGQLDDAPARLPPGSLIAVFLAYGYYSNRWNPILCSADRFAGLKIGSVLSLPGKSANIDNNFKLKRTAELEQIRLEQAERARIAQEAAKIATAKRAAKTEVTRREAMAKAARRAALGSPAVAATAPTSAPANWAPLVDMVYIPGGTFWMGSFMDDEFVTADEQPCHEVTLSAYWISRTPITQQLYRAVTGQNPGYSHGNDLPITNVSWHSAVEFCNRFSSLHGLGAAYRVVAGAWALDRSADGYRLPTEAEWEYAARGKDGRTYPWGSTPPSDVLCCGGNGSTPWQGPYPVGQHPKGASAFGLHDMAGNVREWVQDGYAAYDKLAVTDPQGPDLRTCGPLRVLRGGGSSGLRAASRGSLAKNGLANSVGFRCARGPSRDAAKMTTSPGPVALPAAKPPEPAPQPTPMVIPPRPLEPSSAGGSKKPPEAAPQPGPMVIPRRPREPSVVGGSRVRGTCCTHCAPGSSVPANGLLEHLWEEHRLWVDADGRVRR